MDKIEKMVLNRLFELQDKEYKEFHCKLIPTVSPDCVIGVRIPVLRKLGKELGKNENIHEYLAILPHTYYDENNLHGFIVAGMKDYNTCIKHINALLPYIDNWATCDLISPNVFKKHREELLEEILVWIASDKTYTIRFAIGMLMRHYLDEDFSLEYPQMVADVVSREYYVNMMRAWYFATALAKQYDSILPYFAEQKLDVWTHNKGIQKAIESRRITTEQKTYLRTLKIK